jgi:hypothetical protein
MTKFNILRTALAWPGKYEIDNSRLSRNRLNLFVSLILLCLILVSSGCIKTQVMLDVHENGLSDMSVAMGLTSQAKALMSTQGTNIDQLMNKSFSNSPSAVTTRHWTDGDYEWIEGKVSSITMEDLNKRLSDNKGMVQSFNLVQEPGLLKNRFVLDMVLQPFADTTGTSNSNQLFDPGGMVEFQMLVRMPGKLIETNGVYDKDQNALAWIADYHSSVTIHAVSEVWNWVNIGILGGGAGLVFILVLIGAVIWVRNQPKKQPLRTPTKSCRSINPSLTINTTAQPPRPLSKPAIPAEQEKPLISVNPPAPGLLVRLGVRDLLEQANRHVLKNSAVIFETPNEFLLAWPNPDRPGSQREIRISSSGGSNITVNSIPCGDNLIEIKTALIEALKQLKTM